MTDDHRTEADAAVELAARPEQFDVPVGAAETFAYPPGWTVALADHERLADKPRRAVANVEVRDAAGFAAAVAQRTFQTAALYADDETMALTAILNDDHGQTAGWRDNRVTLALRRTPEWEHWTGRDGVMVDQKAFALHVEDGLHDIIRPAAADMLDLAQTFEATTSAKFKGGQRLASGERQFVYEEEIDAAGGKGGQVQIPDTFTLSVAPFYGSPPVELVARFRYTLRANVLALGYKLDRPKQVELEAFRVAVGHVEEELSLDAIASVAPPAR